MANKVSLEIFSDKLLEAVSKSTNEIQERVVKELEKARDESIQTIKETAPRSKRNVKFHFADSFTWKRQKTGEGKTDVRYIVYSKEKYYLSHLLECGYNHYRSGKYIKARPSIKPAEDKVVKQLIENVDKILKQQF